MDRITSRTLDGQVAVINKMLGRQLFYVQGQGMGLGIGYKLHDSKGHSWPSDRLTAREMYYYLGGLTEGIRAALGNML